MGFCASRAWRSNFGCLHRCTLVRAGRNSVGILVVILYFYFFIGLQFRAGQSTMPCLHKALLVNCHVVFGLYTRLLSPKLSFLLQCRASAGGLRLVVTVAMFYLATFLSLFYNSYFQLDDTFDNTAVNKRFAAMPAGEPAISSSVPYSTKSGLTQRYWSTKYILYFGC